MLEKLVDPDDSLNEGPQSAKFLLFKQDVEFAANRLITTLFPKRRLDLSIQDAHYYAAIDLEMSPAIFTELRFSFFGRLSTITNDATISADFLETIVSILSDYGFFYISENVIGEKFDTRQRFNHDWFHRLFDYV